MGLIGSTCTALPSRMGISTGSRTAEQDGHSEDGLEPNLEVPECLTFRVNTHTDVRTRVVDPTWVECSSSILPTAVQCRVNAHTDVRTRFVDPTWFECLFSRPPLPYGHVEAVCGEAVDWGPADIARYVIGCHSTQERGITMRRMTWRPLSARRYDKAPEAVHFRARAQKENQYS
jgi:hypothetical protein